MTARTEGLLVTGLPRSGTSWVGKMLEASGEVVYVNEPMNPQHPPGHSPGVLDARVTHRFQYISTEDDEQWRRAFARTLGLRYGFRAELRQNRSAYDLARLAKYGTSFTLGRLRGRRAMLDDPFAIFSTGWLVQEMGCEAVVLVRDPVSFVGSWRALNWKIHFHELLEQPLLVRDHLEPWVDRMRALVGSPDWLARTCLLWEATYDVVDRAFPGDPGRAPGGLREPRAGPDGRLRRSVPPVRPDLVRRRRRPGPRGDDGAAGRGAGLAPLVAARRALPDGVPADGLGDRAVDLPHPADAGGGRAGAGAHRGGGRAGAARVGQCSAVRSRVSTAPTSRTSANGVSSST
jgi:hypothetical protein